MADLEQRLGEELRRRAGGFEPSPDLPARIAERTRSRAAAHRARRRTAGRVVGGLAVAAAVVVGLPLVAGNGDDDSDEATSATVSPATTASGGAAATRPASATTRAGGATTAAAGRTDSAGDAASPAPSTTAAAGGTAAAAAGATNTAAGSAATTTGAAAAGGAPASLVAVTADGVVVVDAASGAVVRSVAPATGLAPGYSESGDEVYVFDGRGCGATVQAYRVADGSSLDVPGAWTDATAVTSAGARSALAAVRATGCATGAPTGFELVLELDGEIVQRPIDGAPADGGAFTFSPDGSQLAWTVLGGVAVFDVAALDVAAPQLVATPPGCSATAPAFRSDGALVVARRCGDQERLVVAATGEDGGGVPGLAIVGSVDIDPARQDVLASGSTADGVEAVVVVESGGAARQVLAAATGARWIR